MYLEMKVHGFALDSIAQMPVVILKDTEEVHTVPVWIGAAESVAFAAEFVGKEVAVRNGRKDVLTALLDRLDMTISMICIDDLQDGVFSSSVHIAGGDPEIKLDVHISEAMLLSLKYRMSVMVNSDVLAQVSKLDMSEEGEFSKENNARRFVDFLDQLDPASLGKYPM